MVAVTSAEVQRDFALYREMAEGSRGSPEPVTVMDGGKASVVILAASEFARLKRRDRRAILASELTDEEIALIAKAEAPDEYAHLDDEIKDWHP